MVVKYKDREVYRMKVIGLLGGTGWSSTIEYYRLLNELVNKSLGGYHSAKILLKSIDYHDIMMHYGKNHTEISRLLQVELTELFRLNPDCVMICCNSLHKYYDMIKGDLHSKTPIIHSVELVAQYLKEKGHHNILLLATKFTMEDGFFANTLEKNGISTTIPERKERDAIEKIHSQLMQNMVTEDTKKYFIDLIAKYSSLDAVVLGCTEFPLAIDESDSVLPIVNPMYLQAVKAVEYALGGNNSDDIPK
jgi:aspartate racemase